MAKLNTMQMQKVQSICVWPFSAGGKGRLIMTMTVRILLPAKDRELNDGQKGKKDNTEQMWILRWDSPVDEGRILCFVVAVFIAYPLAEFALKVLRTVHAAERRSSILFFKGELLFLTVFSRSVGMKVEVDRERKADSRCWDTAENKL